MKKETYEKIQKTQRFVYLTKYIFKPIVTTLINRVFMT